MLCLVTDLHCDPEGQTFTLAALTKASKAAGRKKQDEQAVAYLEDRDQQDYVA